MTVCKRKFGKLSLKFHMRLIQSQIDATCPLTQINLPQTWGKLSQMKYKKPNQFTIHFPPMHVCVRLAKVNPHIITNKV